MCLSVVSAAMLGMQQNLDDYVCRRVVGECWCVYIYVCVYVCMSMHTHTHTHMHCMRLNVGVQGDPDDGHVSLLNMR